MTKKKKCEIDCLMCEIDVRSNILFFALKIEFSIE